MNNEKNHKHHPVVESGRLHDDGSATNHLSREQYRDFLVGLLKSLEDARERLREHEKKMDALWVSMAEERLKR